MVTRWLLESALVIAAVGPVPAAENEAEAMFRSMERRLRSSKTMHIRSELAITDTLGKTWSIKAALSVGEGDRVRIEVDGKLFGELVGFTSVSDGKSIKTVGISHASKSESKEESAKGAGDYFRRGLPRDGLFGCILNFEKRGGRTSDRFKLADFRVVGQEQLAKRTTKVIQFSVVETGAKDPLVSKIWLDDKTNLPSKLIVSGGKSDIASVSETYHAFTINAEVDSKLFVLPI
jgi:outer membrane lipoprotein-sorting protein